jgi:CheY-like chemotaxis protein
MRLGRERGVRLGGGWARAESTPAFLPARSNVSVAGALSGPGGDSEKTFFRTLVVVRSDRPPMKVFLCPNSQATEQLIRKAASPLGLTVESSMDVRHLTDMIAASEEPVLVLMSTQIGDVSGLSVCEELTAAETSRPISVLLMGNDTSVGAIANAFASGADDYLMLPSESTLLSARIGAAARRLVRFEHMPAWEKKTSSNRAFTTPVPLGAVKPSPKPSSSVPTPPVAPPPPSHPSPAPVPLAYEPPGFPTSERETSNTLSEQFMMIPTIRDAKSHTLNGFKALHIPGVVQLENIQFEDSEPSMGAWSALLLPSRNLWLDVVVETDRRSAEFLYRHLSGVKPVTAADSASAMVQLVKTLKEQLQHAFLVDGEEVIMPILPRRVPASELSGLGRFVVDRMRLALGSSNLQVCVSYYASERASIYKKIEHLRPRDVTDEVIPLPEGHHPLLNRGVMLDDRKLNLLRNRFISQENDVGIRVFEPSAVSSVIQYS